MNKELMKAELIESENDPIRYRELLVIYRAHRYSPSELKKKIDYNERLGDKNSMNIWKEALALKEEIRSKIVEKPVLTDLLKEKDCKVFFWQGESKVYVLAKGGMLSYSLKLSGDINIIRDRDGEKIKTKAQYKTLTALGFKTANYRTYMLETKGEGREIKLWLTMFNSKIKKLKIGDYLTKRFMWMPNK